MTRTNRVQGSRLIDAFQTVVLPFGDFSISVEDATSLCTAARVRVVMSGDQQSSYVLTYRVKGWATLRLRTDLPESVQIMLMARAAAFYWRPKPARNSRVATLVGMAAVLPRDLLVSSRVAEQVAVVNELLDAEDIWCEDNAEQILSEFDAICVSRNLVPARSGDGTARELFEQGRDARRSGDLGLADKVLRRAAYTARAEGDWLTALLSYTSWGTVGYRMGALNSARARYRRAVNLARRHDLRADKWRPLHDWFNLEAYANNTASALELASRAVAAYGPDHPQLYRLAADVGFYVLTSGYYLRVLPLYRTLVDHFTEPFEKMLISSNLAWAAAGAGHRALALATGSRAAGEALVLEDSESATRTYCSLAHAYNLLGEWGPAESAARCALEVGTRHREPRLVAEATCALSSAQRRAAPTISRTWTEEQERAWDALLASLTHALTSVRQKDFAPPSPTRISRAG